jgi:hypothetical protein
MEQVSVGFELWRQLNDFPLQNPALTEQGSTGMTQTGGKASSSSSSSSGSSSSSSGKK